MCDGQFIPMSLAGDVGLAHFPHRSPWQRAAKSAIGRLKVIAVGREMAAGNVSNHYNADFDKIRNDPASLLRDAGFIAPSAPATGLVEDPIDYQGGELRHTVAGDPMMKAIAGIAAFGEALATQHARLLDTNEGARLQVHNWSLTWTRMT
jgi:hypothetical protein